MSHLRLWWGILPYRTGCSVGECSLEPHILSYNLDKNRLNTIIQKSNMRRNNGKMTNARAVLKVDAVEEGVVVVPVSALRHTKLLSGSVPVEVNVTKLTFAPAT